MRKKYGKLQKKDNVIVFPGTFERLLGEGLQLVGDYRYAESLELLEQALSLEPEHPNVLGAYAFALYETGNFKEAKEMCRRLLQLGPPHYIEAMELYLTTLIQLREFDEVKSTISALFEEGHIPEERKERFRHLLSMSERITGTPGTPVREVDPELDLSAFEPEKFSALNGMEQEQLLMRLSNQGVEALAEKLAILTAKNRIAPVAKTIILLLLRQVGYDKTITVDKFGFQGDVVPSELLEPDELPKFIQCMTMISERLEKDPTKEEMAADLLFRHAFATYPFEWPAYEPEEIVETYIAYIEQLLGGEEISEDELLDFINQIEMMYYDRG